MCEMTLWRAVLLQAVNDATKSIPPSAETGAYIDRDRARKWLLEDDGDFPRCCIMADIEPDHVRAWATARAEEGWPRGWHRHLRRRAA